MRARAAAVLALLSLAAFPAAAAASPPVSVPYPERADAVAFAAGRVLWVSHQAHGPVVVTQAPLGGGAPSVLATIARVHAASPELAVSFSANASGFLLAARDQRTVDDECACDELTSGDLVVIGGYDGSLRRIVSCTPKEPLVQTGLVVAAGRGGFAFGGAQCGTAAPVETIAADGTVAPVGGIALPRDGFGFGLSLAEPFLAAGDDGTAHLIDTRDGSHRTLRLAPGVDGKRIAALDDGTVVLGPSSSGTDRRLSVWTAGAGAARRLPGTGLGDLGVFKAGTGRVLFAPRRPLAGGFGLGLAALDGSALSAVGAPGAGPDRRPLAFDGTAAAFTDVSCTGRSEVTVVDVTDTSPQAPLGCPVEVVPARVAFSRRGVGTVRVACPNGCVTRLSLYIDLRRPHQVSTKELDRYLDRVFDTRIANATLRLAPSQEPERVTVKLVRPAFALLRRHHRRLRVFAGLDLDPNGAEIAPPAKRFVAVLR